MPKKVTTGNGKRHATPQSLNAAVKSICDIMCRSNVAGAMNYVPELTWILFLRILDEREAHEAEEADALGLAFTPSIKAVNPNRVSEEDTRTPTQLIDFIAEKGVEADAAPGRLRELVGDAKIVGKGTQ